MTKLIIENITKKNNKQMKKNISVNEKRQSLFLKIRIAIKTGNNILLRELNANFYRLNTGNLQGSIRTYLNE